MSQEKKTKEGELTLNEKKQQKIRKIIKNLDKISEELKALLFINTDRDKSFEVDTKNAKDFIMGVFNGKVMIDENGKNYDIPENYASKSKLVTGDKLKLVILDDGTFIYKQIEPVEREKVIGVLETDDQDFKVKVNDKKYNVLKASISYYKAKKGDKLTLLLPKNQETTWATVENKVI